MTHRFAGAFALFLLGVELGIAPRHDPMAMASARIVASALPYLPGSSIPLRIEGLAPPYTLDLLGSGSIAEDVLHLPVSSASDATVIAASPDALAMRTFTVATPPDSHRAIVAVAAYDAGIVVHDARPPFTARSVLGSGSPSDVAIDRYGDLAAGDTAGDALSIAQLGNWNVRSFAGIPFTDAVAFDGSGDLFATNRNVGATGALTRITPSGSASRSALGLTSEGLAVDSRRDRIYVANANDGTISIVDGHSMHEVRRFDAVVRVFSLALSRDGSRLYAVSNQSVGSPFSAAGSVVAFDVTHAKPHVVARRTALSFPIGVAVDGTHGRVFVTDERDDSVYVLDAKTLRPVHEPLATCKTPWKPTVDTEGGRLFIPCAQADAVDVFDLATLRRAPGAPFATGGYPLAVAVWHPRTPVVR